jgi:hypothetical protein
MKVRAFSASSIPAVEAGIQEFLKNGNTPTLAIVFASIAHDLEKVRQVFLSHDIQLFGGSSSGEITDDSDHEESIACMLLDIAPQAFRLNGFASVDQTSYQLGQQVGGWAKQVFEKPAIMVLSAGLQADGEQIVNGIIDIIGYQAPLFGGMAGDDTHMQGSYVFAAGQVVSYGVLALAFDQNLVELSGTTVSGWRGIGTPKTITQSVGNIVYSIDNQPALDVYAKYLNLSLDSSITLSAEFPLLLMRDDETFVLRAAMIIKEDKSLIYAGSVPQGSKVFFSMPPGSEIIDRALENLEEFRKIHPATDAVVMYSCKSRHISLGPIIADEIAAVYKLGRCDFHNNTVSIVLIREKVSGF